MSDVQQRADDYRRRLRFETAVVLRTYGVNPEHLVGLVDELVDTAMFPIEHLLMEVTP